MSFIVKYIDVNHRESTLEASLMMMDVIKLRLDQDAIIIISLLITHAILIMLGLGLGRVSFLATNNNVALIL